MRIKKYDFNYGRRKLMENVLKGGVGAGVLTALHPLVADGADIGKAYPDELMSIESATKGKVKTGDTINANNVEAVKDYLDEFTYAQVKLGREITIRPTTRDVSTLYPVDYLQVSLKNRGKTKIGPDGNVYALDGGPWPGAQAFMDPKTAVEALYNVVLTWGRHDYIQYAIHEDIIGPDGNLAYTYEFLKLELQVCGRTDGTVFQNKKDLLRYHTFLFVADQDVAGTSFLDIWHYDQRKFPDLYGYLPQFRRVRQFPTNQRFEPLAPGETWLLTDPTLGDPLLTWGDFKLVERKPMLAPTSGNWHPENPLWAMPRHGGAKGQTFLSTGFELVPEVIVVDLFPTGYPRAPVSKKRVWIDARNGAYINAARYDRTGKPWVSFEIGWGPMISNDGKIHMKRPNGDQEWSWHYVMCWDAQTNRMTHIEHRESVAGGAYKSVNDGDAQSFYERFFTQEAIQRLGRA